MSKTIGVIILTAVVLATISPTRAQQPKIVPRIGYLSSGDAAIGFTRADPIRLALRKLGYIEGQNIAFEYRYLQGKFDRAPALVAELVRLKVDIMVVAGGILPLNCDSSGLGCPHCWQNTGCYTSPYSPVMGI